MSRHSNFSIKAPRSMQRKSLRLLVKSCKFCLRTVLACAIYTSVTFRDLKNNDRPQIREYFMFQPESATPSLPFPTAREPFINSEQAAKFLGMSAKTLLRFARAGTIPAHPVAGKIRRQWRFLESELYDWARGRISLEVSDPCLNSRRK